MKELKGPVVRVDKKDIHKYEFINKHRNGRVVVCVWDEPVGDRRTGKSFTCDQVYVKEEH